MPSVYFVRAEALGLIKIGFAADMNARMSVMRAQSPDRLCLLGTIEHPRSKELEQRLHMQFADQWSHGEWFHPSEELFAYIRDAAELPVDSTPWSTSLQIAYGDRLAERYRDAVAGWRRPTQSEE